jgi:hypothetical protein
MEHRISKETSTHHTIRIEWDDFLESLNIPTELKPFSVWIRYDGGKHVDIDCSGTPVLEPELVHKKRRMLPWLS